MGVFNRAILVIVFASTSLIVGPTGNISVASGDVSITAPSSLDISGSGGRICTNSGISGCPLSVSGLGVSGQYLVSIKLTNSGAAKLKFTGGGSLALSYGYSSSDLLSFTELSFTGTASTLNTALETLEYVSNGFSGAATLTITATENVPGIAYFAQNGHFYKVGHFMSTVGKSLVENSDDGYFCGGDGSNPNTAASNSYASSYSSIQSLTSTLRGSAICFHGEADRLATSSTLKGQRGYLANITNAQENAFLKDKVAGALNVWIGGTDGTYDGKTSWISNNIPNFNYLSDSTVPASFAGGTEGMWRFYDGPEKGQVFWRYKSGITDTNSWITWRSTYDTSSAGYGTGSTNNTTNSLRDVVYSNWAFNEPNNQMSPVCGTYPQFGCGEDNMVFNWTGVNGNWNDLYSNFAGPSSNYYGYIIEYGGLGEFSGVATKVLGINERFTITYDANGGSAPNGGLTTTTRGGVVDSLPITSRDGFVFAGWFTAASGGIQVTADAAHGQTSNFTLYARWIPKFEVNFYANDGIFVDNTIVQTNSHVASGTNALTITPSNPTRAGYRFLGWAVGPTSSTVVASHSVVANTDFYAQWSVSYVVNFYSNGGLFSDETNIQTAPFVDPGTDGLSIKPSNPTRSGYDFVGWAVGSGNSTIIVSPYLINANTNFYAQWNRYFTFWYPINSDLNGIEFGNPETNGIGGDRDAKSDDYSYYSNPVLGNFESITSSNFRTTDQLGSQVFGYKVKDNYGDNLPNVIFTGNSPSLTVQEYLASAYNGSLTVEDRAISRSELLYQSIYPEYRRWADLYLTPIYKITSSISPYGSIDALGETLVNSGENKTYIFTPTSGYRVKEVLINGSSIGNPSSYTFSNVQRNHEIQVIFEASTPSRRILIEPSNPLPTPSISPTPVPSTKSIPNSLLNPKTAPEKKLEDSKNSRALSSPVASRPGSEPPLSKIKELAIPNGSVVITPTQISEINLIRGQSGSTANVGITKLKSGQRVRVSVISQAQLTSTPDLTSIGIVKISPQVNITNKNSTPVVIDIKPKKQGPETNSRKANVSITGIKKNHRVKVTVISK